MLAPGTRLGGYELLVPIGSGGMEHELAALRKRLHILEGFETIFDALDDILKIVRKSETIGSIRGSGGNIGPVLRPVARHP